jgi:ABC-type multidrug transport system fused ATPase/permease subunit
VARNPLFSVVFSKQTYLRKIGCALLLSIVFSLSCQLEMLALGIITRKGPDFFELFTLNNGQKIARDVVTKAQLETRWKQLDSTEKGYVTLAETEQFFAKNKKAGVVDRVVLAIKPYIPIDQSIPWLVTFLLVVGLLKAGSLFFYRLSTNVLAISVSRDVRQHYFEHIQSLPMGYFQEHNIGSIATRVTTDAIMIADGVNSTLVNYFQTPFSLISTLVLCLFISWKLCLAVFIGLPLLAIPIIFLAKRIRKLARQIQTRQEAFSAVLIEFLSGIQTIKAFCMEPFSLKKYSEHNKEMANLEVRAARYDVAARPILHTIGAFCLVAALLIGLYGLQLELHEVLFFCGILTTAYEPIKKFAEENGRIQRGVTACQRFLQVIETPKGDINIENARAEVRFEKELTFEEVSFGYGLDEVLSKVSFKVRKGEKIGICGPTGAGKSSIVLLLPRLYEPSSGDIKIDGVSIKEFDINKLRETIAFVPQRPFIFHDTVIENIRFGRQYSRDEVIRAAKMAHADEFIQELDNGYDAILAEGGKNLSGGQQQRIAIARALLKRAPLLVLDEATSSLDPLSEHQIKLALKELRGEITQVIIAHRLSTIQDADRIIFLQDGVVCAQGTHAELLELCPEFKKMWELHTSKTSDAPTL